MQTHSKPRVERQVELRTALVAKEPIGRYADFATVSNTRIAEEWQ